MLLTTVTLLLVGSALASEIEERQNCPSIHVFGARETTVGPGFGSSGALVNQVLQAYPGATSEAITYPACGGQSSCGGISYSDSVGTGTRNAASAINALNQRCPNTRIVLIGYSQGGQVFDNVMCGGPDGSYTSSAVPITAAAVNMVRAAIFLGDPHYNYAINAPYQVGTCRASGFAARPGGFSCPNAGKCRLYCDSQDPYCCNGNDANHHQQYVSIYGSQAMQFIRAGLDSGTPPTTTGGPGSTTRPPTSTNPPQTTAPGNCAARWGQCGGQGWTGATCCQSGSTCQAQNQWYSQCL